MYTIEWKKIWELMKVCYLIADFYDYISHGTLFYGMNGLYA